MAISEIWERVRDANLKAETLLRRADNLTDRYERSVNRLKACVKDQDLQAMSREMVVISDLVIDFGETFQLLGGAVVEIVGALGDWERYLDEHNQ